MLLLARGAAATAACWLAVGAPVSASDTHSVTYNHFEQNKSLSFSVDAAGGDSIALMILDTCPGQFTFKVEGIERAPDELGPRSLDACAAAPKELRWTHESRYGGYLVMIAAPGPVAVKKEGAEPPVKELNSVVLVVHVRDTGWALEVGGGFTVDGLVSPRYAFETRTENGVPATFVTRDEAADDAATLGLATFVHAFHHKVPVLALSFGLGLSESSRATYYTGLSVRLSSKAALTGGLAWGNVDRLPPGVTSQTPVTDRNILNDLPTRVGVKPFIAFSYGFLGSKDRLAKPFAGTPPAP
jgi:hypothetical protein